MTMTKSLSIRLHDLLKSEFKHSSTNLRRFALSRKYRTLKNHYRVYRNLDGQLHIGFIDDTNCFCGTKLIKIACDNFDTFAYGLQMPEDVTEWFISEYQEKGMCAYTDMRHVWNCNDGHVGTTRFCVHCGHKETKRSKMVEKTWWE